MNSNMLSMLNQLRQNPMSMLGKFNISQNVNLSDPNNIIQHLMNTGQISQQAVFRTYRQTMPYLRCRIV